MNLIKLHHKTEARGGMSTEKQPIDSCVLTFMHGADEVGHFEAMGKSFELPVVAIMMWEYVEVEMDCSISDLESFGRMYSFPKYYLNNIDQVESLPLKEIDARQQVLEKKLNIENNALLVSYDRDLARIRDYRDSRNVQLINLMFVDMVLSDISPVLIISCNESYIKNLFRVSCENDGIPCLGFLSSRTFRTRLACHTVDGQQFGMKEAFEALEARKEVAVDLNYEEADQWFDDFVKAPLRPKYVELLNRSFLSCLKAALVGGFQSIVRNYRLERSCRCDRDGGLLEPTFEKILNWPLKALQMAILDHSSFFEQSPPFEEKYFYLPLHFSPEVTDLLYGNDYSFHEGFVTTLSKKIPSEYRLIVKEHTAMLGRRPLSFYSRLKKLPNVIFAHHGVSTFELIRKASAVVAVTGTAGFEGYLLNVPVIVLGDVFYNFLPGVLKTTLASASFSQEVKQYLNDFVPDVSERKNALRAEYVSSFAPDIESDSLRQIDHFSEDRGPAIMKEVYDAYCLKVQA